MLGTTYTVTLTVRDKAGNEGTISKNATTVKPKASKPTASFNNTTWAQSKTVTFSGLSGGTIHLTYGSTTETIALNASGQGTKTFTSNCTFTIWQSHGNYLNSDSNSYTISSIDRTAPTFSLSSNNATLSHAKTTWTVSDSQSGPSTLEWRETTSTTWNSVAVSSGTATFTLNYNAVDFSILTKHLSVRAKDNAGNYTGETLVDVKNGLTPNMVSEVVTTTTYDDKKFPSFNYSGSSSGDLYYDYFSGSGGTCCFGAELRWDGNNEQARIVCISDTSSQNSKLKRCRYNTSTHSAAMKNPTSQPSGSITFRWTHLLVQFVFT